MKILLQKSINIQFWNDLVINSSFPSPFQTNQYYQILKQADGYVPLVFGLSVKNQLKAILLVTLMKEQGIKGFFSSRGVVFGGPVLSNDITEEELGFFLNQVVLQMRGKAIYLETRNFFDYSDHRQAFINAGWVYKPYLNFQLSLKNVSKESILKKFKYNRRREIKQSISEGVTYGLCANEKEVDEVYYILHDLYKTKVKLPLPSLSYFLNLYHKNIAKVFIVKHNGKTIGGSICPVLERKAIYTYYYCGLRNYQKKIFPTHLAVLAAMEYAIDNYITKIDFMGAGKPNDKYGVRDYKSQFGGELVEHGRFIKVLNPLLYQLGKLGVKLMAKI